MRRLFPNPLALLRGQPADPDVFAVHLRFTLDGTPSREELEDASLEALEVVEARAGDVAVGAVSGCDFSTGEIELDFTVLAERSSELHKKVSQVVRVLEDAFPRAHERSSETEVAPRAQVSPVPA